MNFVRRPPGLLLALLACLALLGTALLGLAARADAWRTGERNVTLDHTLPDYLRPPGTAGALNSRAVSPRTRRCMAEAACTRRVFAALTEPGGVIKFARPFSLGVDFLAEPYPNPRDFVDMANVLALLTTLAQNVGVPVSSMASGPRSAADVYLYVVPRGGDHVTNQAARTTEGSRARRASVGEAGSALRGPPACATSQVLRPATGEMSYGVVALNSYQVFDLDPTDGRGADVARPLAGDVTCVGRGLAYQFGLRLITPSGDPVWLDDVVDPFDVGFWRLPSELDVLLLAILYDRRVLPGMTAAEVDAVFPSVYRDAYRRLFPAGAGTGASRGQPS